MPIVRTAVALDVKPGHEGAYVEWLKDCPRTLGGVYARVGITSKAVVMSGNHVIAHYESREPGAVEAAFSSPEAGEQFAGAFGQMLAPGVAPTTFSGVLAWESPVEYAPRHVALTLQIKPGQESAYLRWVREDLTRDFEPVWRRAQLARKEVLVSGNRVIAFYQARDSRSVLDTFAQPESVEVMQTTLGPLLDLGAGEPMQVYEEVFVWSAD
jgi:hypothetical protein